MKPIIFFVKEDEAEQVTLHREDLVHMIEMAYQSGLSEGKALLDNFDFEFKE